jgi:hypothetical protein
MFLATDDYKHTCAWLKAAVLEAYLLGNVGLNVAVLL